MARYWVGTTMDWHSAANWSAVSGGAGGAGVPTATDDVFIDGNGYVLCWANTPFECNDFTILAAATEMCLFDQGGVINRDFEEQAGYFGPTGGGGYTVEFKGNWLKTGGTFAVGTGTGVDPTCEFSGVGTTYQLNDVAGATYQNFLVSGEVTFSGTRLSVAAISQEFRCTGTMTIVSGNRIDLLGSFEAISGTITGQGRFLYSYGSSDSLPVGGTIAIKYFRVEITSSLVVLTPRNFANTCIFELEYTATAQVVRFDSSARHYFEGGLVIYADSTSILTGEFDCDTNTAEIWCGGDFNVYKDAFPNGTFTLKWGGGTQVFRRSIDLYFSYSSATTGLVVDPGEGTIILYPQGLKTVVVP